MRLLGILAAICCLILLPPCGGGSSSSTSTITVVGVSCNPSTINALATSQCTASVSGTGSFSSTVTWTASGNGTINSSGLFTASTVPFTSQVTITAISTQDTTKLGTTVITVATAGAVTGVTATCAPTTIQGGQLTACTATVNGTGGFSRNVTWTANGGVINPITGVYSNTTPGPYTVVATSQQDPTKTAKVTVTVVNGVNNVLPIVVDGGPPSLVAKGQVYVNGSFATVTVCPPGSTTCQTIDHVLVDTGSIGLRLLAQGAAGGELDPTPFPLQTNAGGNPIAQCYGFVDGFVWGSVSLATINLTYTNQTPAEVTPSVPIQIIGDPRVPSVPSSCSATSMEDESNLSAFMANGVLGVGVFQQDCGLGCTSGTPPAFYYSCSGGSCTPTLQALAQQVPNPDFVLPADNNGVLIQLPSVPAGGTTAISGNLIFGIGTQTNNVLGSATVFDTDANGNFVSIFNGQTNSCSAIDSGSNAYFFPSAGYPGLITCSGNNSSFYCPTSLLTLSASNSSAANTNGSTGTVSFNVGNANTLFGNNGGNNIAFIELGGPNSPVNGCNSFDWGLPFFYGKPSGVFTGIEQQPVTGTTFVGPFWAY